MSFIDDKTRIHHIFDAILKLERFSQGRKREDLDSDDMLLFAMMKALELAGEAASRISPEFKSQHSEIPWKEIITIRNRLIHGYFDIDHDILWNIFTSDIPSFKSKLEVIIKNFG